jgi:hypothetical protein
VSAITEESRQTACKAYEEADKLAKEAWEGIKKAHKKKDKKALEEAVKDFCKAMELVYETWPNVVEELRLQVDTPAMETAYLGGYSEATKGYGLTADLGVKRGDHVAARTLYKASRIWS